MKNGIFIAVAFAAGAAAGVFGSRTYFRKEYEKRTKDEISSVRAIFSKRLEKYENPKKESKDTVREKKDAETIMYSSGYHTDYSDFSKTTDENDESKPFVISPDDFGNSGYDAITLYYYADNVLVDEDDEIVDRYEKKVGKDFAEHFGEYEDDSVFIRNDILECDFEILRDSRRYADVILTLPPRMGADGE